MAGIDTSYPGRVEVIERLMKERGLSLKRLSHLAPVSDRTLKRILKEGAKAHLATYAKLAKALKVDDVSTLYVDNDPPQETIRPANPVEIDVKLHENASKFDETDDLQQFVEQLVAACRFQRPVRVIAVILGSVTVRLEIDLIDLGRVLYHFLTGHLGEIYHAGELTIHSVDLEIYRRASEEEVADPTEGPGSFAYLLSDAALRVRSGRMKAESGIVMPLTNTGPDHIKIGDAGPPGEGIPLEDCIFIPLPEPADTKETLRPSE
jgi:transcriptional regulator with XRE-family HTH domain